MDAKVESIGSLIQVPSVREMAKDPTTKVPHRFVRLDQEPPVTENASSFSDEIPVISFQNLLSGESNNSELQKLHFACKEWGFFQLIDYGVSTTLVEKVKREIKDLFELPMEEKEKLCNKPGDTQGFVKLFRASSDKKFDWADVFFMALLPTYMRDADLFSRLPLSFRDTMEAYFSQVKMIFMMLLDQMAKALKIAQPEEITDVFDEVKQAVRMNYYPPCPQPDLVMGLPPHSDAGGLTILLQLNDVVGLEIKKNGMWTPIKPLPNAFLVNVGDSLEILTNGIYRSIEHRATVNKEKERISVATFHGPNPNGHLRPAPSLVTPETPALFKSISVADFYKEFLSEKFQGKSHLEIVRIGTDEE